MRTRLLTLVCEKTGSRELRYFLVQQADVTGSSGMYGGSFRSRVPKRMVQKLLGYSSSMQFDFPGPNITLASITVVLP